MQTESRDASWLASYAEVQLILCKDIKNMRLRQLLSKKPVVISFFFEIATGFDDISLFFTFLPLTFKRPSPPSTALSPTGRAGEGLFYLSTTFTPAGSPTFPLLTTSCRLGQSAKQVV